ncbi:MAG: hypothetical protein DRP58_07025 [Spirochaetes bacterium]|nr:MAG: hypothetical protein DRP58_07025 [Spirochaetota bacterium]
MAEVRKIIQVENSKPLISKKKRRNGYIAFGAVLILGVSLFLIIYFSTRENIVNIGDYTIATVISGDLTTSTEASGTVVLPTQVSIVNMERGYASKIFVKIGDTVSNSTVLAILDVPDLEENRDDLESNLFTANIDLEEIELSLEYSVKELETSLRRIQIDISEASLEVSDKKKLLELQSSRQSDYEGALDQLEILQEQKEDLIFNLERQKREGELSIRKQKAQIKQMKTSLNRINQDINDARITSPIAGDVLSLNEDLTVTGSLINQNASLFTIADTSDVFIDLEVYEQYSSFLEIGGRMELLISSNIVEAEITQIGQVASLSSDGLAATITVRARPLGNVDLTPGASAVADIPLGTKENALLLPRGSYLTTGNQKYVYLLEGNKAYKTEVAFGEIQGTQVEVLNGLKKGDRVIISSYQNFIDQDTIELKAVIGEER